MLKFKTVSTAWNYVQVMWMAFVVSVPVFVFVAYLMTTFRKAGHAPPFNPPVMMPIIYFLSIMGVASLVGGVILYWKIPAAFFRKLVKKSAGDDGPPSPEQFREMIVKTLSYLPVVIASFFLSCAIYGFVPVILGADFWRMIPYAGASLAALIVFWPRRGLKKRIIAKIAGMSGVDAATIDLGSDVSRRASRMKIIALSLIILWLLLHTAIHLFVHSVLGNSSTITTPMLLMALGAVLFWGLLAWRFQRFGGLCLIIFWSLMFVITITTMIREKSVPWPFLPVNILWVALPLVSGILYYLDYRRQVREDAAEPAPSA